MAIYQLETVNYSYNEKKKIIHGKQKILQTPIKAETRI